MKLITLLEQTFCCHNSACFYGHLSPTVYIDKIVSQLTNTPHV